MNRQRIRDITFLQRCNVCGYSALGRQFAGTTTYEGGLIDQSEFCQLVANDPHADCEHWRRAEFFVKPE
jgi:hypothetical protein